MGRRKNYEKEIDILKECIDTGHDYVIIEVYLSDYGEPPLHRSIHRIQWQCRRCKYIKTSTATEEQLQIINKYKTMNPI